MTVEAEIFERGKSHTGLSSIVGSKIYPYDIPQGISYPVVTYESVSGINPARASGTDHSLKEERFQINGWTKDSALQAINLADEIESAYNRWAADGSAGGTVVQQAWLDNRLIQSEDIEDTRIYHVIMDFIIHYEA